MKSSRLPACLCALAYTFSPASVVSQALYLAGPASVSRTDTAGANWTILAPGGPEWSFTDVALDANLGTVYFMLAWQGSAGGCVSRPDDYSLWCEPTFYSLTVDEGRRRLYVGAFDGSIRGCNFDGNARATLYSGGRIIFGMDVDQSHERLYWADYSYLSVEGRILRADILNNGFFLGDAETIVSGLGRVLDVALEVDGGKVYWVDATRRQVQRANLDGSSVETIASTAESPSSVAVDSMMRKVYWVESPQGETIMHRANLDGSAQEQLFRLPEDEFFSLDVGPEVPVGAEQKGWNGVKQLYR